MVLFKKASTRTYHCILFSKAKKLILNKITDLTLLLLLNIYQFLDSISFVYTKGLKNFEMA